MLNIPGRLQFDSKRGVVYFHSDTGLCVLRVEGIRGLEDSVTEQIDIHLVEPGGEHHHENCGNRQLVLRNATRDEGTICAVKLKRIVK